MMTEDAAAILMLTLAPRAGSSIDPFVRRQALLDLREHLEAATLPTYIPKWLDREFAMLPPPEDEDSS